MTRNFVFPKTLPQETSASESCFLIPVTQGQTRMTCSPQSGSSDEVSSCQLERGWVTTPRLQQLNVCDLSQTGLSG